MHRTSGSKKGDVEKFTDLFRRFGEGPVLMQKWQTSKEIDDGACAVVDGGLLRVRDGRKV